MRPSSWRPTTRPHVSGEIVGVAGGMEGRLLWDENEIERESVLDRVRRED